MNRIEFMAQLKMHLRKLPFDEVKDAVEYYEQYFDDAGEENEQTVLSDLGSPSAVSSQLIASFAVKDTEKSAKKGLSTTWMAILAVFASPLALPSALVVVVLAFALVIVILSVIAAIGITGIGSVFGGITSVITSIFIVLQSFPTSLFFLGLGLIASGVGLAVVLGTVQLSKICFPALAKSMGKFILRRNKK